jgi:hypothetical protein
MVRSCLKTYCAWHNFVARALQAASPAGCKPCRLQALQAASLILPALVTVFKQLLSGHLAHFRLLVAGVAKIARTTEASSPLDLQQTSLGKGCRFCYQKHAQLCALFSSCPDVSY